MLCALMSQDTSLNSFEGLIVEIEDEHAAKNRHRAMIINHDIDLIIPKYSSHSSRTHFTNIALL